MSNVTVTVAVASSHIVALRHDVAEAVVRAYGAERAYGEALCGVLPADWYLTEHSDKSEAAKPVHAEKGELFKVLKAAKHTNPSTVWARVRKYAQEYMEGAPETAEGETAEGGDVKTPRSMTLRLVEELTLLHKAGKKAESLSNKEQDALTYVASALGALGIDLATL